MILKDLLLRWGRRKTAILHVLLTSLALSCLFSFFVYPKIAPAQHLVLDPDHLGKLGYGLWKNHTFSYYPDPEPTLERGPMYPLFMALLLTATNGWWPFAIQAGQCLLIALTCLLVYWMARTLWNRPTALLISLFCAIHPLLFWYTSRIWLESLSIFMFTSLAAAALYFSQRPTGFRGILLGSALAACILTKGTYLPFLLIIPGFLIFLRSAQKVPPVKSLVVFATALVLMAPWTYRNWRLSHKIIPVQARAAYNLWIGDELVVQFFKSPFSLNTVWPASVKEIQALKETIPGHLPRYEKELRLDAMLQKMSRARYLRQPLFLLKKIGLNSLLFWTFGDTRLKSLVWGILLLPLAVMVGKTAWAVGRQKRASSIQGLHLMLILSIYLLHLPLIAVARYSVALVPLMVMYSFGPMLARAFPEERYGRTPAGR